MTTLGSTLRANRTIVVVAIVTTLLFVFLRLIFAMDLDASRFIIAGSLSTGPPAAHDIHVDPGTGYDGQFYYRMARKPLDFAPSADGIRMDTPIRFQRVAYPALAFLVSFGQPALLPPAMILVNVAMLLLLVAACVAIAVDSGRDPRWGLLVAGFFGLLTAAGRDLTEPTEVAFLACGVLAMRRDRPGWAAAAFSVAVLSRETAILVVAAYLIAEVGRSIARREPPRWRNAMLVVPVIVFALWHWVIESKTGTFALSNPTGDPMTVPFVGLARALPTWLSTTGSGSGLLRWCEAAAIVAITVAALRGLRTHRYPAETLAFALMAVFTLSLPKSFWTEAKDFRSLAELWLLAGILVLATTRAHRYLPLLAATAFAGVFGFRALVV